jgi:hypothetical protein
MATRIPPASPKPTATRAPDLHEEPLGAARSSSRRRTPTPEPPPPSESVPTSTNESTEEPARAESQSVGLAAAVVGANLFYVPAKLAYAAAGALTGAVVLVIAHDTSVANAVWTPTLGGDYVVTAEHVRGNAPLHFAGGR